MIETMWLIKTLSMSFYLHLTGVLGGCVDLNSVGQDGKMMISSVFKMVDSVSLYECVSHCLTVSACKSVSYQRETRTCHLASQDSAGDPGYFHTDPEFFHTDLSQWPRSFAASCEYLECASGGRCVVDRFNNPRCVSEEQTACGSPPDLANANKSSTGQYEGAVTQYTCLSDFLFCGTSSTHTCSSLGTWEGLSGACNRAVWYNPTNPVKERMPCPMTEGFKVVIKGRPTAHRRVSMFIMRTNMQLQADVRMKYYGSRDTFWLNKKINGSWTTDLEVPLTLAVGVNFICEFIRQNGKYEIYIDGRYIGFSEDTTPDMHPDVIGAAEDVQVDRIIFLPA